ncbi:MAG: BadF/BadG/BcrA/BcrD ATPase family protein [Terracidiphilus sp.]
MSVVLGVDGGGTNTRAAIFADGRMVGKGQSGSIKRLRVGAEAAEVNLRMALNEACAQAGVKAVNAACCGIASPTMPGVKEWVTAVFDDFGVARSEVVGDVDIALDAAFEGGPGILQIAGTGSNCVGRAPNGSLESAGGWSSRLGDEGSGYWIGVNSVRRALHALDRDEPCRVIPEVMKLWGTKDMDEFINLGDGTPGPDYAALAPTINELAEAGDAVAVGTLEQAAKDLVDFVLLVRSKLRRKYGLTSEVPVAWTGSVIAKTKIVREKFFAGLRAAAPEMPVGTEEVVALKGAIWRAERLAEAGN